MRIVHTISTGGLYGAERVLLELGCYQRDAGHDVTVLATDGAGVPALAAAGAARGVGVRALPAGGGGLAGTARRFAAALDALAPELVHSHGYKPDVMLALPGVARRATRVATCHNWFGSGAKDALYEWLDKRCLRGFDAVVAVSAEVGARLARAGVAARRLAVVANGIDFAPPPAFERGRERARLGCRAGDALLLRVGRLSPEKGNDVLLEAFARLPAGRAARLAFVGDGPGRVALEADIAARGLGGRVSILGFRDDLAALLLAADAFVISSRTEGLPISLLEAMALGCPVVSTAVGEVPRVAPHGEAALIADVGSAASLAAMLAAVLEDPAAARVRAAAAHARYRAEFSRAAMGARYDAVYARARA
jgi:glycosyltransferase involved in cell wall biosynthesis